jgi:alpha-tubulin suppressor-like RCC1 family protein
VTTDDAQVPTRGYSWGYNNAAGLGIGNVARALHPVPVELPAGTIDVQGGTDFTVALTSAGQVWAWGGNRYGQLGDGGAQVRFAPERVRLPEMARVGEIAVGQDHVLALTREGDIYAWGRNHHGQLGDGSRSHRDTPVRVPVQGAAHLGAGNAVSAAVTATSAVLTWGRAIPSQTGYASGAGLDGDLTQARELPLPDGAKAAMVDAGQRHLVVLTDRGELLTFGVDPAGKPLPNAITLDPSWGPVTWVSAGDNHTAALTNTGAVLTWGANQHGQLGTGDTGNRPGPVVIRIPKLRGRVVELSAGADSVLARTDGHQVYAWGHGGFGQNGNGTTEDLTRPRQVQIPAEAAVTGIHTGRYHSLAIVNRS